MISWLQSMTVVFPLIPQICRNEGYSLRERFLANLTCLVIFSYFIIDKLFYSPTLLWENLIIDKKLTSSLGNHFWLTVHIADSINYNTS